MKKSRYRGVSQPSGEPTRCRSRATLAAGASAVISQCDSGRIPMTRLLRLLTRLLRLSRAAALAGTAALLVAACAIEPRNANGEEPQAVSLLGTRLYARTDSGEIARADSSLAGGPADVERLMGAATAYASAWRFNDAIELYTRALAIDSTDARLLRHRGHRLISVRRIPDAIVDLERAAELDSLSFDIAYHLGLAHYLAGHWERAAEVYRRCLAFAADDALLALEWSGSLPEGYRSCMQNATDPDSRVAMTDWYYRALRRAGRDDEAAALLETIGEGMKVEDNLSYYTALLFYRKLRSDSALLAFAESDSVRYSTAGYALANWRLAEGDTAGAVPLLERIARGSHWPGFGVIAAEADLARLAAKKP